MVKMIKDLKWNIEYLWDEERQEPYKNLVNFHTDGTSTVDKIYYEFNSNFGEPYEVETPLDDILKSI